MKGEGISKKLWFKKPTTITTQRMKLVKSTNTKLEKCMKSLLKKNKIKYISQPRIKGKPDFRIKATNLLIYCDSSFWHGRRIKERTGEAFKKNKDFWINKLVENRKRDARTNRILTKEGWRVLRFWDTDILKNPEKVVKRLTSEIKK